MNKEEPTGEVNHLISEVKMQITNSNTGPQRFNRGMVEGEKKRDVKKPKTLDGGEKEETRAEGPSTYSSGLGLALGKGSEGRSPSFLHAKLLGSG